MPLAGLLLATLVAWGDALGTPAERDLLDTPEATSLPRRLSEGQEAEPPPLRDQLHGGA